MGEVFDRRLRELDEKAKSLLGDALRKNSEPALIRSVFDLPAAQRAAIQNAVNETFSAEIHLRFETAPDLVSGIELTTNGQKVGWSIRDYLASLEKGIGDLLKEKDKPESRAEPKPQTIPEQKTEPKVEPNIAAKATPKADMSAEIEAKPKPATENNLKPKARAETKVEELEPV
jgi:F-type H+-transporting ATPase subunit b